MTVTDDRLTGQPLNTENWSLTFQKKEIFHKEYKKIKKLKKVHEIWIKV